MRLSLDCIPCFFRQALEGSRLIGASSKRKKQILDEFASLIPSIPLSATPPEIARLGYGILRRASRGDPYKRIKIRSNRFALSLLGRLRKKVFSSRDRLLTALKLAIAGNIIDFGVKNNLDIRNELKKILSRESRAEQRRASVFHYAEFKRSLDSSGKILYLADNAGETLFDRILLEEIKRIYPGKEVLYAVKERPVINDALVEDAQVCGVGKFAKIISNGSDAPGTVLSLCSRDFKKAYKNADMIISKGQGNFESLSGQRRPIFFLFMVKCPVVAGESGCRMGDIVLLYSPGKGRKGSRAENR
ncbi:MAG: ARMT1-like domain-containing protein [Candidatus Omnitrophica bacterium]|nr:ARMT1-like domain-containing protein [Candidatus Omnitrophota bacterium]MDD5501162.1 ARMT1-like domain-containing protein [Candidatus Omnitrophota bacterium]